MSPNERVLQARISDLEDSLAGTEIALDSANQHLAAVDAAIDYLLPGLTPGSDRHRVLTAARNNHQTHQTHQNTSTQEAQ